MSEPVNEQQNKMKPSRRKYIITAGIIFLLIISALVISLFQREPKPDPDSDKVIRSAAAIWLEMFTQIDKNPNDLTDEDFAKIKKIKFPAIDMSPRYVEVSNIKMLEKFSNLEALELRHIHYPERLIPKWMKILTKIGVIDPKKRFALDISPLRQLKNLKKLDLGYSNINNIKSLKVLINLETLNLYEIPVSDLEPLHSLINLQTLEIYNIQVSDFKPISDLVNLQRLLLYEINVMDFDFLAGLQNLQTLELCNIMVADLEPVKELKNLEKLEMFNVSVKDLEPLKSLSKLQKLRITGCKNITDEQVEDLQAALPDLKIER